MDFLGNWPGFLIWNENNYSQYGYVIPEIEHNKIDDEKNYFIAWFRLALTHFQQVGDNLWSTFSKFFVEWYDLLIAHKSAYILENVIKLYKIPEEKFEHLQNFRFLLEVISSMLHKLILVSIILQS